MFFIKHCQVNNQKIKIINLIKIKIKMIWTVGFVLTQPCQIHHGTLTFFLNKKMKIFFHDNFHMQCTADLCCREMYGNFLLL